MNDLLIDLTTKHHRGAMLNAKGLTTACSIAKDVLNLITISKPRKLYAKDKIYSPK